MAKQFGKLLWVKGQEVITEHTHYAFLYRLQSALLLALWQQGTLDTMQLRYAQQKLDRQRLDRAKKLLRASDAL